MPEDTQSSFAEQYAPMSDQELIGVAREYNDLLAPAQAALTAEFRRRGLKLPAIREKPARAYGDMSNRELLRIARGYDRLPAAMQDVLRAEFASRGLEPPLSETQQAESEPELPELPPDADDTSVFVTIARYRDMPEAFVARSVLESAGVACILRDENTVRMDWLWSNLIGGMRLQVAAKDEAAAREFLSQPIPPNFEVDSGPQFEQPACPRCGSVDVVSDDRDRKVKAAAILVLFFPVPAAPREDVWKCNACGCKWSDDGEPEPPLGEPLR